MELGDVQEFSSFRASVCLGWISGLGFMVELWAIFFGGGGILGLRVEGLSLPSDLGFRV